MREYTYAGSAGIPIFVTLFVVAFGVLLGLVAGREALLLHVLASPFIVAVIWLARNYRGWDEWVARPEESAQKPQVSAKLSASKPATSSA